jgi:hypothetical protein
MAESHEDRWRRLGFEVWWDDAARAYITPVVVDLVTLRFRFDTIEEVDRWIAERLVEQAQGEVRR